MIEANPRQPKVNERVIPGATVILEHLESGKEFEFTVGQKKSGSGSPYYVVSRSSRLGNAILGSKVGDVVPIDTPKGKNSYEVLSVDTDLG